MPEKRLCIGERVVDFDGAPYVVAEAGVNHNGRLDLARSLIEFAAAAGAEAVKFQIFEPAKLTSPEAPTVEYQERAGWIGTQRTMLEELVLPDSAWKELRASASTAGLHFGCSVFDSRSLGLLTRLEPDFVKVASGELTNHPLLSEIAGVDLPIIVSTGMANLEEIAEALDVLSSARSIALLHCVSAYPTKLAECNLRAITTLARRFSVPVGWSDHTVEPNAALVALALGARIFEKHLTLDRRLAGPDHSASSTPTELRDYVALLAEARTGLGSGAKERLPHEEEIARKVRRSWHARRDICPGERLTEDSVVLLRPATGVPPGVNLLGAVAQRSIRALKPIPWDAVLFDQAQ